MPEPGDAPYHLAEAELADYVGERLDVIEAESAESHLAVCSQCTDALQELRAGVGRERQTQHAAKTEVRRRSQPGGLARLVGSLRMIRRPALLASLVLVTLVVIGAAFLIKRAGESKQPTGPAARAESTSAPDQDGARPSPSLSGAAGHSEEGQANQNTAGIEQGQGGVESPLSEPGARATARDEAPSRESDAAIAAVLSNASRRAITSALTEHRLKVPPILAQLRGARGTLLGEPGDGQPFVLLGPVGKVVQSTRPTFRWAPLKETSSYLVTVTDDKLNVVATSGPVTKTEWSPGVPLKRGRVYSWQVTAFKDGQAITSPVMPAPLAKFMILDAAHDAELKRVRGAAPRYHLGLGVLYAQAGLLDEAEQEFRAALKDDPGSGTATKLLQSVRSMTR